MTAPMRARLFLLLLWTMPDPAAAGAAQADALWRQGDYRGAFARAFEPALHGNARAQFLLGEAYRLGRSVDASFPQAQYWYLRAARQGDLAASTELGLLYASQRQDRDALPWLSQAALHGDGRALCTLAALYYNGDGIAPDPVLAFALMSRAAASGLMEAKVRLITLRFALPAAIQVSGQALADGAWAKALQPPVARPSSADFPAPPVRIQLGAFRSAEAAERAWGLLARQLDRGSPAAHAIAHAGGIYRLEARLPDAAGAQRLRRRLEAARWPYLLRRSELSRAASPR